MALITCPECGASVSDKAIACPSCGHPMKPNQPQWQPTSEQHVVINGKKSTYLWMVIAIIATIFALFSLLSTCHWKVV
jgi:uncharacterized membrane protein YvbJ